MAHRTLGFALAPQPCDIADAAEGLCELTEGGQPVPPAARPPAPVVQRPAVLPNSIDTAKAWAMAHSTEILLGAAAVCVLAIALGGRRK